MSTLCSELVAAAPKWTKKLLIKVFAGLMGKL